MKIDKVILLLLCLWMFHSAANLIYLKIDTMPPIWDPACHSLQSIKVFDIINSLDLTFRNDLKADIVGCTRIYPPLLYLIIYPFYKIFGTDIDVAVGALSVLFYLILILSVYKIGEISSGKRSAGLLAAFLITMYPFIYSSSKQFLLDFPLTAIVSLAILVLIKTDFFRNRKYSILFGIVFGLGLLVKESFLIFIAGPFLFNLVKSVHYRNKKIITNVILLLAAGLSISFTWYSYELFKVISYAKDFLCSNGAQIFEGDPLWFKPEGFLFYVKSLIISQTSFIYFLIFAFSMFFMFKKKESVKVILLIWFFTAFLALSFMKSKDVRYSMPLLPCVAVISAIGMGNISKIAMKHIFTGAVILYSISQFILQSFNIYYDRVPSKIFLSGTINKYLKGHISYGWAPYPKSAGYDTNKIFKIIFEEEKRKPGVRKFYITYSDELFNGYTLRYLAMKQGLDIYFTSLCFLESPVEELNRADKGGFVIHMYPCPGLFYNKNKSIMDCLSKNTNRYHLMFSEDMSNNVKIYVYKIS